MQDELDVLIVGSGPAGCAAGAVLARSGWRVALLEGPARSRPRAGELLPPAGRPLLEHLGLWPRFLQQGHQSGGGIRSAWGQAAMTESEEALHPYGPWWHLDREAFDGLLRGAAEEAGAELWRESRLLAAARGTGRWTCGVAAAGGSVRSVSTALLVDASGRAARISRLQGVRCRALDSLAGLAGRLDRVQGTADAEVFAMVEATELGWWYSSPLPDGTLVAVFFTDTDLVPLRRRLLPALWQALLHRARHTRARLRDWRLQQPVRVVSARTAERVPSGGEGWLAAGDAAHTRDPLSSAGIVHALESGLRAGRALDAGLRGDETALGGQDWWLRAEFANYLRQRSEVYGRERRWPEHPFWQRRSAPDDMAREAVWP